MNQITQKIEKIVLNAGVGKLRNLPNFDEKILPEIENEFAMISGQHALRRKAKKSIASFKLREGDCVGIQVTLRRKKMSDFAERLINLVLPRVRDFRGLDLKNIDQSGSLNIGLRDQKIFPEIDPNTSRVNFGLQITIVPKKKNREAMIDFYRSIGVPLRKT